MKGRESSAGGGGLSLASDLPGFGPSRRGGAVDSSGLDALFEVRFRRERVLSNGQMKMKKTFRSSIFETATVTLASRDNAGCSIYCGCAQSTVRHHVT